MRKYMFIPICILIAFNAFAQNDRSKKVKTMFLQLPVYDITLTDPASVHVEFSAGNITFGDVKLKDTKTICVPKGGGLKDAVEVTTYYYEVAMTEPDAYIVAKDAQGSVVYAEVVSKKGPSTVNFGYEQCAYWIAETMKKDWKDNGDDFKSNQIRELNDNLLLKANEIAQNNIYPSYIGEEIEVYGAKGKDFDYSQLDRALEDAVAAYEEISESGPNGGSFSKLEGAVVIWENELAELDTENKKARINVKIAKGLYENLANAYSYLYSGDQAVEAAKKGVKLYGNFSTPRSQALEARMNVLQVRQIAAEKNSGIISNPERLAELGELAGKSDVAVHQMPGTEMARLESEYSSFVTMHAMARHEAEQQKYDEAVASGEVNPYEKYITETTTQGKMIMMTPFTMAPELTELPAELCSISDLSQIMITGNKIATIPSDISNLGQLKKLDLSNNQIENIPPEIGMLTSLKTLNLSGNPISSIPDEIKNCTSLKTLNLKNTNLPGNEQERISELLADTKIKF